MTIKDIKSEMKKYRDFYGGDLITLDDIDKVSTKKGLAELINSHHSYMEAMSSDAASHLNNLKRRLNLHHI